MSEDIKKENGGAEETTPAPRKVNRVFAIVVFSVFISLITLPMLAWGVFGIVAPEAQQEFLKTGEAAVEFPSEFNYETIMSELDSYFSRHIPFRATIVEARKVMDGALEKPYLDTIRPAILQMLNNVRPPQNNPNTPSDGGTGTEPDLGDIFGNKDETTGAVTEDPAESETETLPDEEIVTGSGECLHEHLKEIVEQEPTCKEWGIHRYECEECGYVRREYMAKLAHAETVSEQVNATCSSRGHVTYKCTLCGDTREESIDMLEHDYGRKRTVTATATTYGYTERVCRTCNDHKYTDFVKWTVDNSYYPPSQSGAAIIGREGWLFYPETLTDYNAQNVPDANWLAERMAILRQLQDICDAKGIQLQIMVMPNKCEVYSDFVPTYPGNNIGYTQKKAYTIMNYVRENSDINYIYPIVELRACSRIWQTYYKHDTHWNSAGAFIGTQALYEALGVPTTDLLKIDIQSYNRGGPGDLINLGGLSYSQYNDDINYNVANVYRPAAKYEYHGDVGGAGSSWSTASDPLCDKNFVMFSDSFRISMIPFLMKDFGSCMITHNDNVWQDNIKQDIREADIIVISSVERYEDKIFITAKALIEILSN